MYRLLAQILANPGKTSGFCYTFVVQVVLALLKRVFLPHLPRYQTLRLQIQRAYLVAAHIHFPSLVHRLPIKCSTERRARRVGSDWTGYVIPGTQSLEEVAYDKSSERACVVLYAHGGGYAAGEARMYLNYMERWIKIGARDGLKLCFLSVEYPLSTKAAHPAQLNAFLKAYEFLLKEGISSKRVVFMGDSAGGGLALLSGIELLRRSLQQPAASILVSPWMDMSLRRYQGGNALVETDYVISANTLVPNLTAMWLGDLQGSSSEINPLYCGSNEIKGLNPQLILTGGGEIVLEECRDLAALFAQADVKHKLVVEWGQLHIYAMGSAWVDPIVREKTDAEIVSWIDDALELCNRSC